MVTKQAEELRQIVLDILSAAGTTDENASDVAEHLVIADMSGVVTHGVTQLPGYIDAIRADELLPRARPETLKELDGGALVTGNWTFGQVAAKYAAELGIKKAGATGVALVSIVQSHHIGRLGHYVEMAASEGMISLVCAGGFGAIDPQTVPYGGRTRVLHTNPIAMGFPVADAPPMMFDFATTSLSGVKVVNAQLRGETLPPGAIVDAAGNPTTDPQAFFDGGAHLPFGAHKGYALMMAAEFLGRVFSGSDDYAEEARGGDIMRHQGVTMLFAQADLFRDMDRYLGNAAELVGQVHAAEPAPGFTEVLAPGDLEARTRVQREREGIPLHDDVWQSLLDAAASLGVAIA